MYRRTRAPILTALVLVLGPGCAGRPAEPRGSARPLPHKADAAGWPVYEQPADGFALALPPGWTALDLNPESLDRMLAKGLAVNPDLKAMEPGIRAQAARGVKFIGMEKVGGGPNVNVAVFPLMAALSLDEATTTFIKEFDALRTLERPLRHERVRLKAGPAERVDVVMPVRPPGQPARRLALTSYLLVRGQRQYVLTTTASTDEAVAYAPTFERIAQSFRLLDGATAPRSGAR